MQVAFTRPWGTAGSQLNSFSPSAPKYQWPVAGRHEGMSPVRVTSTATFSIQALIV
ncbi:hypothetical protein OG548_07295 [Streptomyces sp. NBC_01356]|uniref:hypothetical protein n=1 Tax=Streptomyces sp. NBC_01356 TaxID=2903836 RepID=UPI002E363523|nr:hypothetical protein [Streptomyces sp. NBC_01356]